MIYSLQSIKCTNVYEYACLCINVRVYIRACIYVCTSFYENSYVQNYKLWFDDNLYRKCMHLEPNFCVLSLNITLSYVFLSRSSENKRILISFFCVIYKTTYLFYRTVVFIAYCLLFNWNCFRIRKLFFQIAMIF